jgi:alanine dehydrogenase
MPGAVARTATFALTNATLPYVLRLAGSGLHEALQDDAGFRAGLNIHAGKVTYAAIADLFELPCTSAEAALRAA